MTIPSSNVVVSRSSYDSSEPYDVIESNISFVNALFGEFLREDELSTDALRSYYVDYYLAQVNNGGFSQFVYNSRWATKIITRVWEGLSAMGARQHLELFERARQYVGQLVASELEAYLDSEYFDDNPRRDQLDAEITRRFLQISAAEDLVAMNSRWLRSIPNLSVLTVAEMEQEVGRRGAALPDRELRMMRARAREPRYVKLIRALCAAAGHELSHVTAGDPTHQHEGRPTLAWHFITNAGHHYMVEADGKALMFGDTAKIPVAVLIALPD